MPFRQMHSSTCTATCRLLRPVALIAGMLLAFVAAGRGNDPTDEDNAARLAILVEAAAEYTLTPRDHPDRPYTQLDQPVLRYSNPVRGQVLSDGAVFLWRRGERPVAAATFSIRNGDNVSREFTALTEQSLVCRRGDETIWTPESSGLLEQGFERSPEPAGSPALRLTQMRSLARRFSGTYYKPRTDEPTELRLVSQPLYRFQDADNGINDAAVFCLAEANDPEVLLTIELASDDDSRHTEWRYSLMRMSSVAMTIRLDDVDVWSTKFYWDGPRSGTDPYIESNHGPYPPGTGPAQP